MHVRMCMYKTPYIQYVSVKYVTACSRDKNYNGVWCIAVHIKTCAYVLGMLSLALEESCDK